METRVPYIDSGGQIDRLHDIEKAFDKVPHKKLISKLWYYNFHPDIIRWISSFLMLQTAKSND